MCIWVPSSVRPGLHIANMDHDLPHTAGAMGGDIFLFLFLSLFLSFSFQFSSVRVIIHPRTSIHSFSNLLLFSQFTCSNKINFYISYLVLFCCNPTQRSVSNEPGCCASEVGCSSHQQCFSHKSKLQLHMGLKALPSWGQDKTRSTGAQQDLSVPPALEGWAQERAEGMRAEEQFQNESEHLICLWLPRKFHCCY